MNTRHSPLLQCYSDTSDIGSTTSSLWLLSSLHFLQTIYNFINLYASCLPFLYPRKVQNAATSAHKGTCSISSIICALLVSTDMTSPQGASGGLFSPQSVTVSSDASAEDDQSNNCPPTFRTISDFLHTLLSSIQTSKRRDQSSGATFQLQAKT